MRLDRCDQQVRVIRAADRRPFALTPEGRKIIIFDWSEAE
jgi:hypothetical protein